MRQKREVFTVCYLKVILNAGRKRLSFEKPNGQRNQ